MRVTESRISKANVCGYFGREIPDWEKLGLQADKIYYLYRDADELRAAAHTFEGKPLLMRHVAIDADVPRKELWVGTIGKVTYEHPYLVARPLMVWDAEARKLIESGEQRELSSAYRYRALMVPGSIDGHRYDGRMLDIQANHVAIVSEGRAGPDVHVADELPEGFKAMKNLKMIQRLLPWLKPGADLMALDGALGEVPAKSVMTLSKDEESDAEDEALSEKRKEHGEDAELTEEEREEARDRARDKKAKDARRAKDKKARDEEHKKDGESEAEDEEAEEEEEEEEEEARDKKKAKDRKAKDSRRAKDSDHREDFDAHDGVTKDELTAAVREAEERTAKRVRAETQALQSAREAVKPIVGQVSMALDSAADVYKFALEHLGVNIAGVPADMYGTLLEVHQSASKRSKATHAMDSSSSVVNFDSEFARKRA